MLVLAGFSWATYTAHAQEGQILDSVSAECASDYSDVLEFLEMSGLGGLGFENYAPNGTQIRFTVDGDGNQPVILGHTDMEGFAGKVADKNYANPSDVPAQWVEFDASCHSCHATAAYNTRTGGFFPFNVTVGALPAHFQFDCEYKPWCCIKF